MNCITQRVFISEETANVRVPTYEGTSHFFLWGILQSKEISAAQICDERPVSAVETNISFLN